MAQSHQLNAGCTPLDFAVNGWAAVLLGWQQRWVKSTLTGDDNEWVHRWCWADRKIEENNWKYYSCSL